MQRDLILIALGGDSPHVHSDVLRRALAEVESRLESVAAAAWTPPSDPDGMPATTPDGTASWNRIVVVPLGFASVDRIDLRTLVWMGTATMHHPLFLAAELAPRELGAWIQAAARAVPSPVAVEWVLPIDATAPLRDQLAAAAYWAERDGACRVRFRRAAQAPFHERETQGFLPVGLAPYAVAQGTEIRGAVLRVHGEDRNWEWLAPESLATWIIGRYLDALQTHPVSLADNAEDQMLHNALRSLANRQYALLPSQYAGNLDRVSPQSMGSASLIYDDAGLVRWDAIWTSFCDLAMAGGPPHRGTLLEPPSADAIQARRPEYDQVVAELRRGIALATGLNTRESTSLGWVGVCCRDETMAAWMLRAIIVENILVRREGSIVFVPCGPGFRVEKEIKNVITAVAKTAHYWLAHLKTRQPPKPL